MESTLKKDKAVHVGNTILSSTSKFLVKSRIYWKSSQNTEQGDDAVLYKPHDKTAQFNQINTHKMKIYGKFDRARLEHLSTTNCNESYI